MPMCDLRLERLSRRRPSLQNKVFHHKSHAPRAGLVVTFTLGMTLQQQAAQGAECREITYLGTPYTLCTADLRRDDLRLYWKDPKTGQKLVSLGALRQHLARNGHRLEFATNAGIYAPGNIPLGLHVEEGKTLVPLNNARSGGNFALKPNGVFYVREGRGAIVETSQFGRMKGKVQLATQSGPLLLRNGHMHPAFRRGSVNLRFRSGVGILSASRVVFALSNAPVNFYDFTLLFRDRLRCSSALYLDGSISRMYCRNSREPDTGGDFAGMLAISSPLPRLNKGKRSAADERGKRPPRR